MTALKLSASVSSHCIPEHLDPDLPIERGSLDALVDEHGVVMTNELHSRSIIAKRDEGSDILQS